MRVDSRRIIVLHLPVALLAFCLGIASTFVRQAVSPLPNLDAAPERAKSDLVRRFNPRLILKPDGIVLVSDARSIRQKVPPGELAAALNRLPEDAWPYGRAMHVEESCIYSGDDSVRMTEISAEVGMALRSLNITVYSPPC